jgi:hypothetical protein
MPRHIRQQLKVRVPGRPALVFQKQRDPADTALRRARKHKIGEILGHVCGQERSVFALKLVKVEDLEEIGRQDSTK